MLQSLDTSADDIVSAASTAKPVKLNAVVTKGHIRVVPKPGLQVVAPHQAEVASLVSNSPDITALDPVRVAPARTDPDSIVLETQPAAPATPAPWNTGFSEGSGDSQPIDSDILPPAGLSMKMIKLIAAAAVLGIAAIVLTFLQFSGADTVVQSQGLAAPQGFAPAIAAADASTLPAANRPLQAPVSDGTSADMVAQITAGTLAALRNGPAESPATVASEAVASAAMDLGETTGLYAMVLTALQQGQSRQYIDQMVNEAHRSQQVEVPALLLTSSGEVNTSALLTLFGGQ